MEDFELLETLGRGASSVCRKARHKPSGELMALKIINVDDASMRQQLVNELRTLVGPVSASCRQFVGIFDAFYHEGTVYIALEYMDCGSVDQLSRQLGGRVPEAALAFLLHEM